MKKVLLSVLAVGMLTACSQDETVDVQTSSQIAFTGAFVNNVTRAVDPSITNEGDNALAAFSVWGYVENNESTLGEVFDAVEVTKDGEAWTYSPLQYWLPNNTYHFFALATNKDKEYIAKEELSKESLAVNGLGSITFENGTTNEETVKENGTEDLLYAAATVTTGESITTAPAPVKFVFDHLLSKVKFTFKNGFATGYSSIKVTNIRMTAPAQGTIELNKQGEYTWKVEKETTDPITLAFGDLESEIFEATAKGETAAECADERLTIPAAATQKYTVTFDVELLQDGATVLPATEHEVIISNYELKPGFAYNFVATLTPDNVAGGLKPIEFEAEVEDWVNAGDQGFFGVQEVDTEAELVAAIAKGGSVKLMENITISSTLNITSDTDLNLNGKTLTNKVENTATDVIVVAEGVQLTINGEGTVEAVTGNDGYTVISEGTVIINSGTFKSGVDAEGAPNAVIYARENGKVYVNGGNFPNENSSKFVLNKKDADRATTTIEVRGGTYGAFNPGNNAAEGAGTNFVAPGYESVAEGDYFVVKAK